MEANGTVQYSASSTPKCLAGLPVVEMQISPVTPGIYFLSLDGDVVYVGKSNDPARRVREHIKQKLKEFDSVFVLSCEKGEMDALEQRYIKALTPEYNVTGLPDRTSRVMSSAMKKWAAGRKWESKFRR